MAKVSEKKQREHDAVERLRGWLPPGATLYTTVNSVARSGMSRTISCFIVGSNGDIMNVSGYVAFALGYRRNEKTGGVVVGGCGMDMGFHIANSLSYRLHGNDTVGVEAKKANDKGYPFSPKPDNYRAGYSINHRWL